MEPTGAGSVCRSVWPVAGHSRCSVPASESIQHRAWACASQQGLSPSRSTLSPSLRILVCVMGASVANNATRAAAGGVKLLCRFCARVPPLRS
jgi:SMC interacting uncharacterized protein involved in chromosome segregation